VKTALGPVVRPPAQRDSAPLSGTHRSRAAKTVIYALDDFDLFNLLVNAHPPKAGMLAALS